MAANPHAQQTRLQQAGWLRWGAVAALSLLAIAAVAVVLVFGGPGAARPAPHEGHMGAELEPAEILLQQLRQVERGDVKQRLVLHTSAGHIFRNHGRYAKAAEHYSQALGLARTVLERVEAQEMLGLAFLRQGQLRVARNHLETAVAECGINGGTSSNASIPDNVVRLLHTLGDVRLEMGHVTAAIELYRKALEVAEARQDLDESILLAADVSEAWARRGNLTEAFAWLQSSEERLEMSRHSGGGASEVVTAKVVSFIGAAHQLRGDVSQAMEHFHRALAVQAQHLPPHHPDVVATRLAMGRALHDQGDTEGALRAVEAVERTLRSGPQEGPDLSRALMLKGDLLRVKSHFEAAEAAVHEALDLQTVCFRGEDYPDRAVLLNCYGSILHDAGRADEALEKYQEALLANQRSVGEFHPETAATYNSLGTFYEDLGNLAKAFEYFSKGLTIQLDTVGTKSPDVANTYNNLATILFHQGLVEDAASLLYKALRVLDEAGVPLSNPSRAVYAENLQEVLSATQSVDPHSGFPGPTPPKGLVIA